MANQWKVLNGRITVFPTARSAVCTTAQEAAEPTKSAITALSRKGYGSIIITLGCVEAAWKKAGTRLKRIAEAKSAATTTNAVRPEVGRFGGMLMMTLHIVFRRRGDQLTSEK